MRMLPFPHPAPGVRPSRAQKHSSAGSRANVRPLAYECFCARDGRTPAVGAWARGMHAVRTPPTTWGGTDLRPGASHLLARGEEDSGNPKGFNVNSRGWQPTVATARPGDPARVEPAAGPSRSALTGPWAAWVAFRGLTPTAIHVETLRVSPPLSRPLQEGEMRPGAS